MSEHPVSPESGAERRAIWVIAALLLLWGAMFIARTSFVLDGERVFCLFDDAMISMAYARNLVEGRGLQWGQAADPVEGFTHPLWLAVMAVAQLLPLARASQSLPIQIVSLALLLANLWAVRRVMARHFHEPAGAAWPAALLTAGFYPLNHWALLGMEVGLQALLVVCILDAALDLDRGRPATARLAVLLVAVVLLRMDLVLVWICVLGFSAPVSREYRRDAQGRWRGWVQLAFWPALALGLYEVFRWSYFHDLLPNTYALKLAGVPLLPRLQRGLAAWWDFALPRAPALAAALVLARSRPGQRRKVLLPLVMLAVGFLYSITVGGDAWERMDGAPQNDVGANRFVAFLMPLCFILAGAAWNAVAARVRRRRIWLPVAAALALLSFNGLLAP